ncbi:Arm DNA-binding domain-containing protein [Burkholderia gladioli]|uniref:Arm DNA-binding domain-containing protein n=1 Tax=Burkholderia gladioli TaxID=28095 RepID=UPI003F7B1B52
MHLPSDDVAICNAFLRKKSCRLADGGGMYLEVSPTGGKCWRFKCRFAGKESFDDTRVIA